jgi:hypothetical protein
MTTPTISYVAAWATAATGVGTIGLASATYWLARKTRETAEAARDELKEAVVQSKAIEQQTQAVIDQAGSVNRQVEATTQQVGLLREQAEAAARQTVTAEAALNASVQPLLLDVPYGTILRVPPSPRKTIEAAKRGEPVQATESDASHIYWDISEHRTMLSFRVQNAGPGAARLQSSYLTQARDLTPPLSVRNERQSVVAPGQLALLVFSSDDEPRDELGTLTRILESDEELLVEVAYSDVSGRQRTATRFYLQKSEGVIYRITRVEPLVEPQFTRPLG